jgi:hypothetical protein
MGRFEDELLKGLGVSKADVTEEARAEANRAEQRWGRTSYGCISIAFLAIVLAIILLF